MYLQDIVKNVMAMLVEKRGFRGLVIGAIAMTFAALEPQAIAYAAEGHIFMGGLYIIGGLVATAVVAAVGYALEEYLGVKVA